MNLSNHFMMDLYDRLKRDPAPREFNGRTSMLYNVSSFAYSLSGILILWNQYDFFSMSFGVLGNIILTISTEVLKFCSKVLFPLSI